MNLVLKDHLDLLERGVKLVLQATEEFRAYRATRYGRCCLSCQTCSIECELSVREYLVLGEKLARLVSQETL